MIRAHTAGLLGLALIAVGCMIAHPAPILAGFIGVFAAVILEGGSTPSTDAEDDAFDARTLEIAAMLERSKERDLERDADAQHAADLLYWYERHGSNTREFIRSEL